MDDLRQLLRYEIPGLLAIIYSLLLLFPFIYSELRLSNINIDVFSKLLSAFTAFAVVVALPLGYLLYQIYLYFEHVEFLSNRKGMKIVSFFPEMTPDEIDWWKHYKEKKEVAERNEILDTSFYSEKDNLANILERFENFYHSRRVIGIYVPLFVFVVLIIPITLQFFLKEISLMWIPYYIIPLFFIIIIYIITIRPTCKEGFLRREIDELEINILLRRKDILKGILEDRVKFHKKSGL